jgi:2',3'-cyclic-nucleotide 2'-phosphodiesterase (5'-nucleotidase family)
MRILTYKGIPYGLTIMLLMSLACTPYVKIKSVETNVIPFDSTYSTFEDAEINSFIMPYKQKKDSVMHSSLATSQVPMVKGLPEGLLGNFVADLTLQQARKYYKSEDGSGVDICLLNNGGLRTSLPEGVITREKAFELMPFDNMMVVLTLSGAQTKKLFDYVADNGGMPIAGCKLGIKDSSATFIEIGGKAFDISKSYKIATSDYLANGGDKMLFFKNPLETETLGILLRDAIIEYMIQEDKQGRSLNAKLDGRIYRVEED